MSKSIALVVFSGGQDSTTCLAWAMKQFDEVHAITFQYGQRHAVEIESADKIARAAGVKSHKHVDITPMLQASSRMLAGDGELDVSGELKSGIADTFVPLRNQTMLTVAANYAYTIGAEHVVTGVCQTDSSGYPDCRRDFIDALQMSFNLGTFTGEGHLNRRIEIHTPLMWMTKAESVLFATAISGAYGLLAWSHTAYTGGGPLDKDAASLLRQRGFEEAQIPDPLVLRWFIERRYTVEELPEWYNTIPSGRWAGYMKLAATYVL